MNKRTSYSRPRRTMLATGLALAMAAYAGAPRCQVRAEAADDNPPAIRPVMALRPQAGAAGQYELLIYGDIGESWWSETVTALSVVQQLEALDPTVTQINVRINSVGGSVSDGLAIYNALRRHAARKVVTVDGVAMSSASLIAMAGDEVQMPATSMLMVHAPWAMATGNAEDMRTLADVLDTYAAAMAAAYARKTGKSNADMLALLTDGVDHYYTGEQALAEGFSDALIDPQPNTDGNQADNQAHALAESAKRLLANASDQVRQAALAAAARHPVALPDAIKPRVKVPDGIDMQALNRQLESPSGQRALVAALTTAASANDGEITMKIRKLFAALRDTADDPTASGRGNGGAAAPAPAPAPAAAPTQAEVHAALATRNDEIRSAAEPFMGRQGVADMVLAAVSDPSGTADAFRNQLLAHVGQDATPLGGSHRVEAGEDEADKMRAAGSQFLLARSGIIHGDEATQARQGNPFNGMTLMDMARDFAARGGIAVRGMGRGEIIQGALTTSDFPNLLENTLHKAIIGAYRAQPVTWSRFCSSGSLSDFRPHVRLYMGGFSDLKTVNEAGEYEQGTISDADKETITAESKGRILAITHQMIINDDLGVFSNAATMLGKAGARTLEKDVYALLALNGGLGPVMTDGSTLFHANHNNIAGTAAAPGTASFDAIRVLLAEQMDPSGELLDVRPSVWVGPTAIGGQARVTNEAQYDTDTGTKTQTPNRSRGLFADLVDSPRTPDAKRWYAFADAGIEPVIEVGFVDGMDTPQITSAESFKSGGMQWRVVFDYGVGAVSWRGAATNAGA